VLTIGGLDTATHRMKPQDTLPLPGPNYWVAAPCSSYYAQKTATSEPSAYGKSQPWTNCGYIPRQIRGAYHVSGSGSGMTGKGQTVAVLDAYASPTMLSDANEYAAATGDRPLRYGQYKQYLAPTFS
jgi:subtilase family serine protease